MLLPLGVPTSLEAQIGHIRYGLQIVLDRPRWPDQKFEETFTVIKPLNLNNDLTLRVSETHQYKPNANCTIKQKNPLNSLMITIFFFKTQHPIVEEETKRFNAFCFFVCCASDPLFIIATVPVSGYTPGQMMNVDLELSNTSNENLSAFVFQIVRVSSFISME